MFQHLRRKASTVLRYLFPTAADRAYLDEIHASGLFDRDFYRSSNIRLKRLFHLWPERHYVQLGERNGACPNPRFSPRAYLFHNRDLPEGTRPFLHYIRSGRAEGRVVLSKADRRAVPEMPVLDRPLHPDPPAPVAIAVHLYYPEFWDELRPRLEAQRFAYDLFVTITERDDTPPGTEAGLARRIRAEFPAARVWQLPNHGRDILPFVHLLGAGVFAPYRALCKLHSKKSPHRADGDDWRRELLDGILDDPGQTQARLERFLSDPAGGIWVADGHLRAGDGWWGANRARAEALLSRAGRTPPAGPLRFPAGSIYWVRDDVLEALAELHLSAEDFEPEQALVDGTTAHAVERLMGWLTLSAGRRLVPASALDAPVPAGEN